MSAISNKTNKNLSHQIATFYKQNQIYKIIQGKYIYQLMEYLLESF